MTRTRHLTPKPGLLVLDPDTLQALPEQGAEVAMTTYWHRRIADGDVTDTPARRDTKAAARPTAKPAAKPAAQE